MTLAELAQGAELRIRVHADRAAMVEIWRIYSSDRISELLNAASADTLLVTGLSNPHLTRVAQLMDAPAICLSGVEPDAGLIRAAEERGMVLATSSDDATFTHRKLEQCLKSMGQADR